VARPVPHDGTAGGRARIDLRRLGHAHGERRVGVLGSMFIAALNKRMTFKMMNEAIYSTCRPTAWCS
jgi:hypothetical protein